MASESLVRTIGIDSGM
ncbi:hypothetical protein F383_34064 [Gossypium arboreum]|uniref:Uncharacterized protein n=1 Tax=Gossypium arboreum TaxID=29729 RepID=A0A0B0PWT5_GOSAR|nr:hypothetical protein F383_34064 [Gossypium arboreum]